MAEADTTEIAEESSDDGGEEIKSKRKRRNLDEEGRGIVRKILIAGPLFCKFVIVLVIKFMTDLVVFPLLLLYRLARLTRRRIMKMFEGKGASQSEASSSSEEPQ